MPVPSTATARTPRLALPVSTCAFSEHHQRFIAQSTEFPNLRAHGDTEGAAREALWDAACHLHLTHAERAVVLPDSLADLFGATHPDAVGIAHATLSLRAAAARSERVGLYANCVARFEAERMDVVVAMMGATLGRLMQGFWADPANAGWDGIDDYQGLVTELANAGFEALLSLPASFDAPTVHTNVYARHAVGGLLSRWAPDTIPLYAG